jgi:hypothetical protein
LSKEVQLAVLNAVYILDRSPSLSSLEDALIHELRFIAPAALRQTALRRAEGWWWSRIAESLDAPDRRRIRLLELDSYLDSVREEFQIPNLPEDYATATPSAATAEGYDRRMFVHQLRLIKCPAGPITRAKRDYYRAFEQRSKWSRDCQTTSSEISRLEHELIEQWEPHFDRMKAEVAAKPAEGKGPEVNGRDLLHWVETSASATLRNICERYLTVGSYHMLADDRRVGWHADYQELTKPAKGE